MAQERPLYVTGADARFWRCLHQLLRAARRKGWDRGADWAAYDLGLEPAQRARLEHEFPWVRWETLDLDDLPPHYAPSAGSYAWKPHIFWQEVSGAQGPVVWMDSATLPLGAPDDMLAHIRAHGLYLLHGQAPIQERCDPNVLDRLGVPRWTWGTRECVSGFVGVNAADPVARSCIRRWAELSSDPDIISPAPTIDRHMHDQAVLNAVIAEAVCTGEIVLPGGDVDISSGRPVRFISTRNKLSPDFPVWADGLARAYYRVNKIVDQFLHRLDAFHLDHNPFWRMATEYFKVRFARDGGPVVDVPCPFGHYYADPFLIEENGALWAFVEDLNYFRDRATIAAIPLEGGANGAPGRAVQVLDPGCHASFPFLFRHGGDLWMLPESCKNNNLELWRCERFPDRWARHRVVLDGLNCADSIVFEHAGRWWLFTSIESPNPGGMYRYLAIYHADDPVEGDWQPHPINAQGLDITAPRGTGRNAGGVIRHDGQLLRAVQASQDYYGQGMGFREIVALSPDRFEERAVATPPHLAMAEGEGVHHLTRLNDVTIWDCRTRH